MVKGFSGRYRSPERWYGERFGDRVLWREHLASIPGDRERLPSETSPCGSHRVVMRAPMIRKLLDPKGPVERGCRTEQAGCGQPLSISGGKPSDGIEVIVNLA